MREAGADDAGPIAPIGVRHDEQMALDRMTECHEAVLVIGMIGIGVCNGQRIAEDRRRIREGDSVLREISRLSRGPTRIPWSQPTPIEPPNQVPIPAFKLSA